MHHTPSTENSALALLHCDAKTVGNMTCGGVMKLVASYADPGGACRETWQCTVCHAREFHTVYEAVPTALVEERALEEALIPRERNICTMCHEEYPAREHDELFACENCTTWYIMNQNGPN
jgi:hypothetical protein